MKKKLFTTLFASIFMFSTTANANVDAAKAEAFVEKVTKEGIEEIINANVSQTVKDQRFEKLFNNALDLNFIGQFVLGRYWRTSTPEQKKGFINAYRELNIKTWSKRFDEFKGKKFIFKGNVIDMAVGVVIGGSFGKIVTGLVNYIINPFVGIFVKSGNLDSLKTIIHPAVPEVLDEAGAVVTPAVAEVAILWGTWLQTILDFLITALCIFVVLRAKALTILVT